MSTLDRSTAATPVYCGIGEEDFCNFPAPAVLNDPATVVVIIVNSHWQRLPGGGRFDKSRKKMRVQIAEIKAVGEELQYFCSVFILKCTMKTVKTILPLSHLPFRLRLHLKGAKVTSGFIFRHLNVQLFSQCKYKLCRQLTIFFRAVLKKS